MKSKIIILTPVYNDWKNLEKLLKKINKIFEKNLKKVFELIIVNDRSKENFNSKNGTHFSKKKYYYCRKKGSILVQ